MEYIDYQIDNNTISGDNKGRQDIKNIGSGEGYLISEGYAAPITWEKKSRSAQTIYKFKDGNEIKVNDGNTFIQIQPHLRMGNCDISGQSPDHSLLRMHPESQNLHTLHPPLPHGGTVYPTTYR